MVEKRDWNKTLEELLDESKSHYRYMLAPPSARHDMWWLVTAISNLILIEEIRELKNILKTNINSNIIVDSKNRKKLEL